MFRYKFSHLHWISKNQCKNQRHFLSVNRFTPSCLGICTLFVTIFNSKPKKKKISLRVITISRSHIVSLTSVDGIQTKRRVVPLNVNVNHTNIWRHQLGINLVLHSGLVKVQRLTSEKLKFFVNFYSFRTKIVSS